MDSFLLSSSCLCWPGVDPNVANVPVSCNNGVQVSQLKDVNADMQLADCSARGCPIQTMARKHRAKQDDSSVGSWHNTCRKLISSMRSQTSTRGGCIAKRGLSYQFSRGQQQVCLCTLTASCLPASAEERCSSLMCRARVSQTPSNLCQSSQLSSVFHCVGCLVNICCRLGA